MKFTLGFSPCPNDTFIFDALVNKKIDTGEFVFEVFLEDVQTLNNWAIENRLDFSKISYGVLPFLLKNYTVLNSGGALGKGVGPLLISKKSLAELPANPANWTVAIPGQNTTAHMLFKLAYPGVANKKFITFNQVEDAVLSEQVDAGVIIHENRFTYQDKGLIKLMDLGEFWERETGAPIPLGGIVAKKTMPVEVLIKVNDLIKQSLEYSFKKYPHLSDYIKKHAQEMSEDVMKKHIDLYVNNYSYDIGETGKLAVKKLLSVFDLNDINDVFLS